MYIRQPLAAPSAYTDSHLIVGPFVICLMADFLNGNVILQQSTDNKQTWETVKPEGKPLADIKWTRAKGPLYTDFKITAPDGGEFYRAHLVGHTHGQIDVIFMQ